MPEGNGSFYVSALSLLVSISTAVYTHRDRWTKLNVRFQDGDNFVTNGSIIRALIVVFNASSRSNSITKIAIEVYDGINRVILPSPPAEFGLSSDPGLHPVNTIPTNVPVGSGVQVEVMASEFKANQMGQDCVLIVKLTDIFSNAYQLELKFHNNRGLKIPMKLTA